VVCDQKWCGSAGVSREGMAPRIMQNGVTVPIVGGMNDKQLYAQILGVSSPWRVVGVELRLEEGEVDVGVEHEPGPMKCPECGRTCPGYDTRRRQWRHLDTCQYRTILTAEVPRVECEEHGVKQIDVPWAAPGSRFTLLFESLVIDWLRQASMTGVASMMKLSWDQVDGILARAVRRGLLRRELDPPRAIGVDEKAFKKRQDYVTIVTDIDRKHVLHVADGRKKEALLEFYNLLNDEDLAEIRVVAMDMWGPFISATQDRVPGAKNKVAFDKFHVTKHLLDGVDQVRRKENRELLQEGDRRLVGTKYYWLENPLHMSDRRFEDFTAIRQASLRTARAWAMNDAAAALWYGSRHRPAVTSRWNRWLKWPPRCRMQPMQKVGKTIKRHLWGIVNAIVHGVTNAAAEGFNSVVQKLKGRAYGYRNRERFKNAIYFHLGGLDLYPQAGEP